MKDENINLGYVVAAEYGDEVHSPVFLSQDQKSCQMGGEFSSTKPLNLSDAKSLLELARQAYSSNSLLGQPKGSCFGEPLSFGIHPISADVSFKALDKGDVARLKEVKDLIDEIEKKRTSGKLSNEHVKAIYNLNDFPTLKFYFNENASEMPKANSLYVTAVKSKGSPFRYISLASNGCEVYFLDTPDKATHFSDTETAARTLRDFHSSVDLFIGRVYFSVSDEPIPEQEVNAKIQQEALGILSPKSRYFLISHRP